MYRLIVFLKAHKHWFVWLLLQLTALWLFFGDGAYRMSLRAAGTNALLGKARELMTEGYSYLGLREQNRRLLDEYARLEYSYLSLLRSTREATALAQLPAVDSLSLGHASAHAIQTTRVISLRQMQGQAYYIIDKGEEHGVKVDMPVMSATGVMGTVMATSRGYSVVIPITNGKLRLSCTLKGKGDLGTLIALGADAGVVLGGLPNHSPVEPGDTILTSGLSYIFPEGLYVGTVEQAQRDGVSGDDAAFGTYRVRLGTDFDRLGYVYVLLIPPLEEARALERKLDSIQ